jgi:hypothetical protein
MKHNEEKFSKSFLKRNNAVGITHGTSHLDKSTVVKTFMSEKKGYKKELFSNMNRLMAGKITEDEFNKLQQKTIKTHFTSAFLLGKRFNQNTEITLSDNERRMIVFQTTKEMEFMKRFAKDIINNTGKMNYKRRMDMYAGGLDPMFRFADIAYLPEDIDIQWKLGITDKHCLDCLFFAANSPYKKKTLPGVPKSCNSSCLNNCRCFLIYYNGGVNTGYTNFILDNYTDVRNNVPTLQQYENMNDKMLSYYQTRLRYEVTGISDYMDNAVMIKSELMQFIKDNDLAVTAPLYIADAVQNVKHFNSNKRFEFLENTSNVKAGAFVSTFLGNIQVYGKVKTVIGTKVIVDTLFEKGITLDTLNDVIFKEISDDNP